MGEIVGLFQSFYGVAVSLGIKPQHYSGVLHVMMFISGFFILVGLGLTIVAIVFLSDMVYNGTASALCVFPPHA